MDGGLSTVDYSYDPFGRRLSKTVDGVTKYYLYDNEDIIAEYDNSGILIASYVHGQGIDEPISMTRGGSIYYYTFDGLGSVCELTDASQNIVETYKYNSFGNLSIYDSSYVLHSSSIVNNPYTYTGREYDAESGLYFYRARYYDANIGRFITADPIGYWGGGNFYGYTNGNPILYIDPFGLKQWAPAWVEELLRPFSSYGNYGGPGNTDLAFRKIPIDSLDELFMKHDIGWADDQCSQADKNLLTGLGSLPINPYRWPRRPKNILWAIIYSSGATGYFFWFSQ